jgi:hypothetical protein
MAQPQLIQVALDSGGHNAIGVDHEGVVWRGRIQRATSGEEFIVWKRTLDPRREYRIECRCRPDTEDPRGPKGK